MRRWIGFLIAIALGVVLGLLYGWVVNPVEYVDTTPDSLRMDFKTDYVLMVAEAYQKEGNLGLAARRLALLGDTSPAELIAQASLSAVQLGYSNLDLSTLQKLADDFQTWNPNLEEPAP
jgi:hypothetical protein